MRGSYRKICFGTRAQLLLLSCASIPIEICVQGPFKQFFTLVKADQWPTAVQLLNGYAERQLIMEQMAVNGLDRGSVPRRLPARLPIFPHLSLDPTHPQRSTEQEAYPTQVAAVPSCWPCTCATEIIRISLIVFSLELCSPG